MQEAQAVAGSFYQVTVKVASMRIDLTVERLYNPGNVYHDRKNFVMVSSIRRILPGILPGILRSSARSYKLSTFARKIVFEEST